jgi:uncharacterized lipoprotein YddW (UPF0748 family)
MRLALIAMLMLTTMTASPASAQLFGGASPLASQTGQAELRGLWVDAYHDGFKTPEQVDRLVADARRAHVNALFVQVRRRGDSYYSRSLEPRTEDGSLQPGFDALEYIIDKAHNGSPRLEVHAWVVAMCIWGDKDRAPRDPKHPFNLHGPNTEGRDNWIMRRNDGAVWGDSYYIDPGHPDVVQHTVDTLTHLVREYDVDGLHMDRLRYYEGESDKRWGYNKVSVERFNARYGRSGDPDPLDPQWADWRREQMTALVRRVYLETTAVKPDLRVSAAVVPWGSGPKSDNEWLKMSAYTTVFQDWRGWLEEGILDLAVPMNYFRESAGQGAWLDRWVAFQRERQYERGTASGLALYLNSPKDSVAQIRRSVASGADGGRMAGVVLYSYANSRLAQGGDVSGSVAAGEPMWSALSKSSPTNDSKPPFESWVPVPGMPWRASTGVLVLRTPGWDGAKVELKGPTGRTLTADASGVAGHAKLDPGYYDLRVTRPDGSTIASRVEITGGMVTTVDLR